MNIYCPHCEAACSPAASACPKCGHPFQTHADPVVAGIQAEVDAKPTVQTCPTCQQSVAGNAKVCPACGQRLDYAASLVSPQPRSDDRTSTMAIISLVSGIFGLFCFGIVFGVVALIMGETARKEIARNPGMGGGNMATAGRITGLIGMIGWTIAVIYWTLIATTWI